MNELVPLCFLRIWCRTNDAWLSFKTTNRDRFLINPSGYYIELPDGSLSPMSPRVTFPNYERFASVPTETLAARKQYGEHALFVSVPMVAQNEVDPRAITIETLDSDPLSGVDFAGSLEKNERFVLLRALEAGVVSMSGLGRLAELRERSRSIGSALIYHNVCQWETLLGYCLDIRPPSRLDPPSLRTLIERKEWELIGEILHAMGQVNRTQLEYALKIKREGSQALGQILTAMGAAKDDDVARALNIQNQVKELQGSEVALIGKLLVAQGVIAEEDLEDALRHQRIARQPLGRILVSMGACSQRDIDGYARVAGMSFQAEVDDTNLGNYLVKTDTITKIHLEEALRVQQRGRQVLGELLISMGLCSRDDINNVLQFQQEIRDTHRSGVEKLGSILINCGKVPPAKIDEAVKLQSMGRQPIGAILIALGACTSQDVNSALEIQHQWRQRDKVPGDRLGEVLVSQKIISEQQLEEPLLEHLRDEKPLGRILIDRAICTPEQIIEALIDRDHKRHYDFLEFVKSRQSPAPEDDVHPGASTQEKMRAIAKKSSFVDRLSTWFSRPKDQD